MLELNEKDLIKVSGGTDPQPVINNGNNYCKCEEMVATYKATKEACERLCCLLPSSATSSYIWAAHREMFISYTCPRNKAPASIRLYTHSRHVALTKVS